jgi:uncharacterized protein (TIGR02246 family)
MKCCQYTWGRGACIALLFAIGLWGGLASRASLAQPATDKDNVEKSLRSLLEAYANAFNTNDAKKAAEAFSPNAEFIDDAGNRVEGRGEIQKIISQFLADNPGAQIQFVMDGVRLIAPNVALEDGESTVTVVEKQSQSVRRYAMAYVKENGQWLIASVREYPETEQSVPAEERLQELDWLIGEWVDEGGDALVVFKAEYGPDKKSIMREYSIKVEGKEVLTGKQRIAIDPLTGGIKGWTADNEGGYGETVWIKNGDEWLVKGTSVTADGAQASATYLLKPDGKDRVIWKTVHRVVGERLEADLETTLIRRISDKK